MDRTIVYPGAIPLDTDNLAPQRFAEIALGWLTQATMGTDTGVVGLACNPTSPASMTVNVGQGAIWSLGEIDSTDYGSLAADTSPLMKMGINAESAGTNFALTAPATSGQSIDYLIQAFFSETDGTPETLPYLNASNPSQSWSGPNNTGTAQNTQRIQRVSLTLKVGTPATTGSQVAPSADAGAVPLYVVTVANGQTTVTAADIAVASGAPFADFYEPDLSAQIAAAISAAGLTPDRTNTSQLLAAIQGWAGKNIAVFTPSGATVNGTALSGWTNGGDWTVPTGVSAIQTTVLGGGGGGSGAANGTFTKNCGGAAGGLAEGLYAVTPGQQIAITAGAAGTGGGTDSAGASGGTSSCGALCSATGGNGGVYNSGASPVGGVGSGGQINIRGGGGHFNMNATDGVYGGRGGDAPLGYGLGGVPSVGSPYPGTGFGAGGASHGGVSGGTGANGSSGVVIVVW